MGPRRDCRRLRPAYPEHPPRRHRRLRVRRRGRRAASPGVDAVDARGLPRRSRSGAIPGTDSRGLETVAGAASVLYRRLRTARRCLAGSAAPGDVGVRPAPRPHLRRARARSAQHAQMPGDVAAASSAWGLRGANLPAEGQCHRAARRGAEGHVRRRRYHARRPRRLRRRAAAGGARCRASSDRLERCRRDRRGGDGRPCRFCGAGGGRTCGGARSAGEARLDGARRRRALRNRPSSCIEGVAIRGGAPPHARHSAGGAGRRWHRRRWANVEAYGDRREQRGAGRDAEISQLLGCRLLDWRPGRHREWWSCSGYQPVNTERRSRAQRGRCPGAPDAPLVSLLDSENGCRPVRVRARYSLWCAVHSYAFSGHVRIVDCRHRRPHRPERGVPLQRPFCG